MTYIIVLPESVRNNLQSIKPDFSNFDANGAWPYLLDEFVDHMREKQGAAMAS